MRDETELTKRILLEQQKNPTKGDFIELVKEDLMKIFGSSIFFIFFSDHFSIFYNRTKKNEGRR